VRQILPCVTNGFDYGSSACWRLIVAFEEGVGSRKKMLMPGFFAFSTPAAPPHILEVDAREAEDGRVVTTRELSIDSICVGPP